MQMKLAHNMHAFCAGANKVWNWGVVAPKFKANDKRKPFTPIHLSMVQKEMFIPSEMSFSDAIR